MASDHAGGGARRTRGRWPGRLYRFVDAAYEKRSLILTSNLHLARFDTIFPKGLATAAVDRLLHHAHLTSPCRSHRLAEAIDGCGVQSLQAASA
jgi:transposase